MTAIVMRLFVPFHYQNEQELAVTYLRALDHKRAAFAQVSIGLEEDLIFFVELEIKGVASIVLALSIDVQPEILAVREPVFFAGLECFVRLTDELELIVTEQIL